MVNFLLLASLIGVMELLEALTRLLGEWQHPCAEFDITSLIQDSLVNAFFALHEIAKSRLDPTTRVPVEHGTVPLSSDITANEAALVYSLRAMEVSPKLIADITGLKNAGRLLSLAITNFNFLPLEEASAVSEAPKVAFKMDDIQIIDETMRHRIVKREAVKRANPSREADIYYDEAPPPKKASSQPLIQTSGNRGRPSQKENDVEERVASSQPTHDRKRPWVV